MKRYISHFDHSKFTETFSSQKDIYDIVEDLTKLIKNLLKIGIIEYKELGNTYIEASNYYTLIVNSLSSYNYMSASFNIKNILSKIPHRNGAYVDIANFYENYPNAVLSLYIEGKYAKEDAHYEPITKNIVVHLTNNFDNFFMRIEQEKYDTTDIMIAIAQILKSNDFEKNLTHEMTHMYDDTISKQKAVTRAQNKYVHASDSVEGYMSNPVEVNARFYSAVYASEHEKLQQCTSQKDLKLQWERKYFDSINSIVKLNYLDKDQRNRIYKRAWIEFTTLTDKEEKLLSILSKKTMVNNADIKEIDVRIKNKIGIIKGLKQDFIDLSNGKISKSIFNKKDPFDNDELNDEIKTKQEMLRKIEMQAEWENLYYFHDIYKHVSKYGSDDYDTQLLDYLIKDLRLDSNIISQIKDKYNITKIIEKYKRIFEDEESPFVYPDKIMYPIDNIHRARRSLITVHQIGTEEEIEKVTQAVKEKFPELLEVIK